MKLVFRSQRSLYKNTAVANRNISERGNLGETAATVCWPAVRERAEFTTDCNAHNKLAYKMLQNCLTPYIHEQERSHRHNWRRMMAAAILDIRRLRTALVYVAVCLRLSNRL